MISREHENLISRYDDPELSTVEREQLTELQETNDEARELEAQYRRLDAELETLPDGLDGVDFSGFRRRIRESIESVETAPVIRMSHRRLWTRWAPIAAAASVAIAFLSIWYKFKSDTTTPPPIPPESSYTNYVKIGGDDVKPSEPMVNQVQIALVPAGGMDERFDVDLESDAVYDAGGVICFVGTESEGNGISVPSASGFFGSLLKGST